MNIILLFVGKYYALSKMVLLSKIILNDICVSQMCIFILKGNVSLGITLIRELLFGLLFGFVLTSIVLVYHFMIVLAIL